jgi:hypothetical protein
VTAPFRISTQSFGMFQRRPEFGRVSECFSSLPSSLGMGNRNKDHTAKTDG